MYRALKQKKPFMESEIYYTVQLATQFETGT
jgi:hypothetical protein